MLESSDSKNLEDEKRELAKNDKFTPNYELELSGKPYLLQISYF